MATQTTNYGLTKPSYNETADIGVINSNMDIIDAKMKAIENKAGSGGGGGTSDYLQLSNKPKINGVELVDNTTTEDLGIVIPQRTSELENDSGFITNETDPTVPAWAKEPTKPTYTAEEVGALPSNTPIPDPTSVVVDRFVSEGTHIADISVNGEKTELYAPTGGGGTPVTVDSELSTTSENPVQNKVITQALNEKSNLISDAWNASTTYAVGQYCIYNNSLWKCLVQHSGQTPTEGTYWTNVTVANEITNVNNSLGGFTPIIDSTGKITGYKTKVGADTVFPFSDNDYIIKDGIILNGNSIIARDCASVKFTEEKGGAIYVVPTGSSVAKPQLLVNIPQKAKFICATVLANGVSISLKISQNLITSSGLDKRSLCQDISSLSGNYYVAFMTNYVSGDNTTDSRYIKDLWFEY